jgi:hypothetical protein
MTRVSVSLSLGSYDNVAEFHKALFYAPETERSLDWRDGKKSV